MDPDNVAFTLDFTALVLQEFLNNTYIHRNGVTPKLKIGMSLVEDGSGGQNVEIKMVDNGPGIPMERFTGLFTGANRAIGNMDSSTHGYGIILGGIGVGQLGGQITMLTRDEWSNPHVITTSSKRPNINEVVAALHSEFIPYEQLGTGLIINVPANQVLIAK